MVRKGNHGRLSVRTCGGFLAASNGNWVIGIFRKRLATAVAIVLASVAFHAEPARAVVIHKAMGTSINGIPVTCEAHLMIVGDLLTVVFYNTSPVHTQNPSDLCTSYYFDIYNGANVRPVLVYQSATGDVWRAHRYSADTLETIDANLKAVVPNDDTWQFKNMDADFLPFLGFGVGTVGNSDLKPNNFNGNIVGNMNYALYAGDATTQNLDDRPLVKDHITFTFTGVTGFTENDIRPNFAIGLGTSPDSFLVPEPAAIAPLLALGLFALPRRRRFRLR